MNTLLEVNIIELNASELLNINGGTYASGYEAGHSAGATFRKYVDGVLMEWQILRWIFL